MLNKIDKKILSELRILIVDDEPQMCEMISMILKKYCKEIYTADDGIGGLASYLEKQPDILITDIGMPNMNGLDLSRNVRSYSTEIPIIVQTAFADQEKLLESIDIGVDQYIKKPLSVDLVLNAVLKMAHVLENKKMADAYREKLELEKLRENTQTVLSQLSNVLIEPLLLVQEDKIKYVNESFKIMVGIHLDLLLDQLESFDELLEKREGFCDHLAQISFEKNMIENKISMKVHGRKIYQVIYKELHFAKEEKLSKIYLFEDITLLEYQKLKLKHYSQRLEDFLITTKYRHVSPKPEVKQDLAEPKEPKNIRSLDVEELALLRKAHAEPISAQEFLQSAQDTFEDVDELDELMAELQETYDIFCEEESLELLNTLSGLLDQYAHTIKQMQEFDELAEALFSTCRVLIQIEVIDTHVAQNLHLFLENIFQDLKNWKRAIFVDQDTKDIHYLDASLFSSCLQLELNLTQAESQEEEIEFF